MTPPSASGGLRKRDGTCREKAVVPEPGKRAGDMAEKRMEPANPVAGSIRLLSVVFPFRVLLPLFRV